MVSYVLTTYPCIDRISFNLVPATPPYNVTGKSPTGFTAVIEWIHISQYEWNGAPVGTLVKFDDGNGHIGNVTIAFPTTSATLTDLIPSTTYVIDACELTSPGPGPCQRLQVTTIPSRKCIMAISCFLIQINLLGELQYNLH